jgi:uncharacterized membrane protein YcaP (DUF421 family)
MAMAIDWQSLFIPNVSLVELLFRGTVMYLFLFTLLRVLVGRRIGALSLTDLLVVVLIADAAQNGMASEYRSLPEGIVLCATIVMWSYLFDRLAYQYAWFRRLVEPRPLPLIRDGKIQRQNMRQELITRDELMSHLRENGVENLSEVKEAFLEPDGQFSIIKIEKDDGDEQRGANRKRPGASS